MKKTFGKTLAFLLAASVLAAGTFVSCGEKDTDEPTAADSLVKPVGTDPFTKEEYEAVITSTNTNDGKPEDYDYTNYCNINNTECTITFYHNKEKTLEYAFQQKYTYDTSKGTITMAYYRFAVPNNVDAYLSTMKNDTPYTEGWKFGKPDDYLDYYKKYLNYIIATITESLNNKDISEEVRKDLEEDLAEIKQVLKDLDKTFNDTLAKAVTYDYISGNVITLTNANANPKKLVLTPVSN